MEMLSARFRSLAVTVIAVGTLVASESGASASPYSNAPPSFDGLAMLRVAQGYNLTKAYDLSFPATSDEACEIAGVSALTFIAKDHAAWANGPGFDALRAAYDEARAANSDDLHAVPCYWLRSESAADLFSGLPRVRPATLKVELPTSSEVHAAA